MGEKESGGVRGGWFQEGGNTQFVFINGGAYNYYMPPEVMTIFDTIIFDTKHLVIGYSGWLLLSLLGLIVAVFVLNWGWSSLIGVMKSDGRGVTFGSPLGYHGRIHDDEYWGNIQDAQMFFGVSGDEMNKFVKNQAGKK
jgi:hypothetical protein